MADLDFNVPSAAEDHLGTNHSLKIYLHQLQTQVSKSMVKSWVAVLDTTQSIANKAPSTANTTPSTASKTQSTADTTRSTGNNTVHSKHNTVNTVSNKHLCIYISLCTTDGSMYLFLAGVPKQCFLLAFSGCEAIIIKLQVCMLVHCCDTR